jgi:hypothetical protein
MDQNQPDDAAAELAKWETASLLSQPCPASIYLMGTVVNCNRPAGHDKPEGQLIAPTMHRIVIEWKAG